MNSYGYAPVRCSKCGEFGYGGESNKMTADGGRGVTGNGLCTFAYCGDPRSEEQRLRDGIYDQWIDPADDVYTVDQFRAFVKAGHLFDCDGTGSPAKGGFQSSQVTVLPSKLEALPLDATHVVWHNRPEGLV